MVNTIYTSLKSRLLSSLPSRLVRNEDGIAAIEFAFIAPIMLFMYFGMAEVATAISVDRKISHSANVAGDLATQTEKISIAEMNEIMTATMLVMGIPSDKQNGVTIEIASYARDSGGAVIRKGLATLKGKNGIDLPTFNADDLDDRILSSSSGVVVARVNYIYEPLQLRYMPSEFNISEIFMLKPRKSANVDIHELDQTGALASNKYTCSFADGAVENDNTGKASCSASGILNQAN